MAAAALPTPAALGVSQLASERPIVGRLCSHGGLVKRCPETTYDNFARDFGNRFVPGYESASAVDVLMNAPFAE